MGLPATTAALGLFAPDRLGLSSPFNPVTEANTFPIVIYGASSTVGSYALQLAKLAGLYKIAVAGKGLEYVGSLQRADILIDYRGGEQSTIQLIQKLLPINLASTQNWNTHTMQSQKMDQCNSSQKQ